MTKGNLRSKMNLLTVLGLLGCLIFIAYGLQTRIFYSESALQQFLARFGPWAPILFIVFQAVQVIVPILPGGIGCLAGVLIFGPLLGFAYNYIGICLGSICAFLIAKRYGTPIVRSMFPPKLYRKYVAWTETNNNFDKMFTIAIFLPVAPDDFLCYLAGTTKMTLQKFTAVILFGKPMAIALYSFGLSLVFQNIVALLQR
ncbi:TVP38/TMEM64 family protein [Paenibacillus sp. MMS20-IR301]|uniref:TVP38/TMEM64 family protein n=1 Tax=Paenibacillus sp. MMS20-IR301 TaxID=2895946 RepID=UPI0028EDBDC9|nr:TVP38/TMEM64 family protein [Paenibacillus sp. MMS20-IR301]WNS43469.1 TVP38/TMEM64 family protein [Paenibacillus sp. MMS20-IR301]